MCCYVYKKFHFSNSSCAISSIGQTLIIYTSSNNPLLFIGMRSKNYQFTKQIEFSRRKIMLKNNERFDCFPRYRNNLKSARIYLIYPVHIIPGNPRYFHIPISPVSLIRPLISQPIHHLVPSILDLYILPQKFRHYRHPFGVELCHNNFTAILNK